MCRNIYTILIVYIYFLHILSEQDMRECLIYFSNVPNLCIIMWSSCIFTKKINMYFWYSLFVYTYGKGGCICAQLHMMFVTIRGSTAIAWFNQSGKNLLFLGKMYHFFTKFCLKSSRKSVGILFLGVWKILIC